MTMTPTTTKKRTKDTWLKVVAVLGIGAIVGAGEIGVHAGEVRDRMVCAELKSCSACVEKGCFWQPTSRDGSGECAPECEIMDISCFGTTDQWNAACPTGTAANNEQEELDW